MIKVFRKILKSIIYSNDFIFRLYYINFYKPKNRLDQFLDSYSRNSVNPISFIQIGANDGQSNDPFYKYIRRDRWRGILVEPQTSSFYKLRINYKNKSNLKFENVAIAEHTGLKKFYKLGFTEARWASGLSSFKKEDIQRMIDAGYIERMAKKSNLVVPNNQELWITSEEISTISFSDLIKKYKICYLDLLMLDVEGYEYEILKTISFKEVIIKTIIFENTHYSENEKLGINNYLITNGYSLLYTESDTIAERIF